MDIPDAVVGRVLDSFDAAYAGRTQAGLTKAQWAKRVVAAFVKDVVRAFEANRDVEAARLAAIAKAETEITVT